MNDILLFLHLTGLMLGAAGGLSSGLIMRKALTMPDDQARVVRGLGPMLANVSGIGVLLMWITGLILVWSKFSGPASLPALFWVKGIFILSLTAFTVLILMAYADIRKGNAAAAKRLPLFGPLAGVSALLAVLFASFAFG